MQLMTAIVPSLEALEKRWRSGPQGDQSIYPLPDGAFSIVAGLWYCRWIEAASGVVNDPGMFFRVTTVVTLVGGTMFSDVAGRADHEPWCW